MTNRPRQRISRIRAPAQYTSPSRPPEAAGEQALDAYRQTRFVLGNDVELFSETMDLQLALVADANPATSSQYRTPELAALSALWSRAYAALADAMLLVSRGSYASTLPLIRAACELIAAQEGLRAGEMDQHHEWLASTLQPDETHKAFEFHIGRYFAGGVLFSDDVLRGIYRPASDLARPAFGASLLLVGPESSSSRVAVSFADPSFHLGWAEIVLGWLLALSTRQVEVVVDAEGIFPVSDARRQAYERLQKRVDEALARRDRCRIEEIVDGYNRRYLVHNFRRASGGSPKRILL
ncbi:MAG TPA: hypothetical protein VIB47_11600 [Dehalococcoidia bacterium]